MPSDRRLHPWSLAFTIGARLRELALPLIVLLVTAGSRGWGWEAWAPWLVVPYAIFAVTRYVSFRYRYDEDELVIRTGLVFRNERHVPYARIQSVDAVQTLPHRWVGVVEVRLQTAGGQEPEATLSVLSTADYEEMRARVADMRRRAGAPADGGAATGDTPAAAPAARVLLTLPLSELLIAGFIENRGMVLIAAGFGALWEFGLFESITERLLGEPLSGRGLGREAIRALLGSAGLPAGRLALAALAFAGLLAAIRVVSMAWAAVRLHGFTLTRADDTLRSEFGLLTRVSTSIPLRRVQKVTIHETFLHRLAGRVAVRVETAGGELGGEGTAGREWLAPVLRRDALPRLLDEVLPGLDLDAARWHGPHPNAFRRAVKPGLAVAVAVSALLARPLGWWTAAVFALLAGLAAAATRGRLACQGWALLDDTVVFRSGWLSRHVSIAPVAKVQVVAYHESLFDRRTAMARVGVDTAGAAERSHRVDIPWVPREAARTLYGQLAEATARTTFRW